MRVGLIATTLLALSAITSPARADNDFVDRGGWRNDRHVADQGGWRQDHREIRQDRRELRGDYRELAEDRADYQRARARGDIIGMFRERREIHQDIREIRRDRAELHHDLRAARHDFRPNQTPGHQPHSTGWQAPRPQQASPVTNSRQNNGRHLGWEQGRGNPHRG